MAEVIAIATAEPRLGPSCNGCKHCHYSAPGGQAWNQTPHSRCNWFKRDITMVVINTDRWLSSEIPLGCPTYAQPSLI